MERANPLPYTRGASHPHRRAGPPLLPTGFRHRRRGAVQPRDFQKGWPGIRRRAASGDSGRWIRQDRFHLGGYVFVGPGRASTLVIDQRWRHGVLASDAGREPDHHRSLTRCDEVGHWPEHSDGFVLRVDVLRWGGSHHVGLQLRDLPVEATRPGCGYGSCGESGDEWGYLDDVLVTV